jgi:hypothetical protein
LSDFADAFTDRRERAGGRFRHVVWQLGGKFDGHQGYPSVSLTTAADLIAGHRHYPSTRQKAIAPSKNFDTVKKIRVWIKEQIDG